MIEQNLSGITGKIYQTYNNITQNLPGISSVISTNTLLFINISDNEVLNISYEIVEISTIEIISEPSEECYINNPYYYQIIATSDYTNNITYTALSLPNWLSFYNNTITGISSIVDTYTIKLSAYDGHHTIIQEFYITSSIPETPAIVPIWTIGECEEQIICIIIYAYDRLKRNVTSLYFSNTGYISYPTDTPANTSFPGCIKETPKYSHTISAAMDGSSDISFGRLVLMNYTGELDYLISNYAFGRRKIVIYRGNPNNTFSTFKLILEGVIGNLSLSNTDITLDIYDKQLLLDVPIQQELEKNVIPPVAFGYCFNIPGILIDEINLIYKLNYTSIKKVIDIRDAGASFTQLKRVEFEDYIVDLKKAEVQLLMPPYGDITFDIEGTIDNKGWYPQTAADIFKYLLKNHTTIKESEIDLPSFTELNYKCPQKISYYNTEKSTVSDVYTTLYSTIGAFAFPRRLDGKFKSVYFTHPSTSRMDIDESIIKIDGFSPDRIIAPIESILLGYKRNHSPIDRNNQSKESFVSIKSSVELSREWYNRILVKNKNILEIYADAVSFEENALTDESVVPTCFMSYEDTLKEGLRRLKLYGFQRMVFRITGFSNFAPLELGDTVKIFHRRFGFNNGILCLIIGITESEGSIEIEVMR